MTPFLSDAEVAELCAPLTQPAAQVRHLRAMGLTVGLKPNGRPVVVRSHVERVLSGLPASGEAEKVDTPAGQRPNRQALILRFAGGGEHGSAKKEQPA